MALTVGAQQPPAAPLPPGQYPHSDADVQFMSGMIPHHAQAVVIAGWVPERTQRRDVRVLAERIVVAQKDEIALMQTWLSDRGLDVPAADATHHVMKHGDMEHKMLMPGMLSDEELAKLKAARGAAFDRLFLEYMIKHHQGAITMVEQLFKSYGAAQDDTVFRFATDVYADQTTEIDFMTRMLQEGK
ncbi:MAG: DUF305 domain-containing protein [Vicinamibacterales bacterium]